MGADILSGATQVEPGVYEFDFRLRPEMANAGDQPIILQGIVGSESFFSRLDDTAPRILLAPSSAPTPTPIPTPIPTPTPTPTPSSGSRINFALASNGGTASASSAYGGYPVAATINGDRRGLNWTNGGGWNDATPNDYPDWVQIDFDGAKTIDEIDVFTVQDNYQSPSEPDLNMTQTTWGVRGFDVEYGTVPDG